MKTIEISVELSLLLNQWRTLGELTQMQIEDQRNTLIVELSKASTDTVPSLQALSNSDLACSAMVYWLQLEYGVEAAVLNKFNLDQQRNNLIVILEKIWNKSVNELQGMDNAQLIALMLTPHN
ncbi:MAG: hypothetical protein HYZ43_16750 [Flavobacteriia bacterium]|nr:hypothetical protein [Flavobacteriia bacterium]